jgi:hypothetical protein
MKPGFIPIKPKMKPQQFSVQGFQQPQTPSAAEALIRKWIESFHRRKGNR